MDWTTFFVSLVNGLTLGSVYALIALGYSMVYGILKLLNFAHGEVYMFGAFIGYGVLTRSAAPGEPGVRSLAPDRADVHRARWSARACSASSIERFAYRPLRNAPRIAPLISALGVSFFLQNSALLLFGANFRSYDTLRARGRPLFSIGIHVGTLNICARPDPRHGAAVALMIVLTLFVGGRRSAARCARPRSTVRPPR